MSRSCLLIAALLLLSPCGFAAAASPDTSAVAKSTAPSRPADDEVVCKRERVAGSNIAKQVCTTRKQREEMEASAQRALKETQRNTGHSGNG